MMGHARRAGLAARTYRIGVLAFALVALLATGCSTFKKRVAPFQREVLAKPGMNFIENAEEETGMQHMFNAREGSVGGFGGAGGGCGCN